MPPQDPVVDLKPMISNSYGEDLNFHISNSHIICIFHLSSTVEAGLCDHFGPNQKW